MNDTIETDLKKELLLNIENVDSLTQCAICIEYFDKVNNIPVTSSCLCKILICEDCRAGLLNAGSGCPTCRNIVNWSSVPTKIIDLITEFIKMKDVVEQYVVASNKKDKASELLIEIFNYEPESEMEKITLETVMNLAYKLTKKASSIEIEVGNKLNGKFKELERKEKSLNTREESITGSEMAISVMKTDLDAREYNVQTLEDDKQRVHDYENRLTQKNDEYNRLANNLNEESELVRQNEQLVNVREESLTEAEKILKIRETDFESLQKVLESEMNQLLEDKEEFEVIQLLFSEQMKQLERKVISHQADISSF